MESQAARYCGRNANIDKKIRMPAHPDVLGDKKGSFENERGLLFIRAETAVV